MGMRKFTPAMLVAAVAAGLMSGGAAFAGPAGAGWSEPPPPRFRPDDVRTGPVRMPDGRICERLCPQDNLPCDPINFKIADGRCNGRMWSPR
ncbi:hypothetical protein ACFFJB_01110 [Camelimonas abortus]|uniref:Kazal-type serine protease inhibitor-like protein n=1 Tax=Camelimonas abortus TaxID=1017184 RepID=A0ABV7LBN9_9HYPH